MGKLLPEMFVLFWHHPTSGRWLGLCDWGHHPKGGDDCSPSVVIKIDGRNRTAVGQGRHTSGFPWFSLEMIGPKKWTVCIVPAIEGRQWKFPNGSFPRKQFLQGPTIWTVINRLTKLLPAQLCIDFGHSREPTNYLPIYSQRPNRSEGTCFSSHGTKNGVIALLAEFCHKLNWRCDLRSLTIYQKDM